MNKRIDFYISDDVRQLPSFKALLLDLKSADKKDVIVLSARYGLLAELDEENNTCVFKKKLNSTGLTRIKFNKEDELGLFLLEEEDENFESIKSIIATGDDFLIDGALDLCKTRYENCKGEFIDSLRKIYLERVIKYIEERSKFLC